MNKYDQLLRNNILKFILVYISRNLTTASHILNVSSSYLWKLNQGVRKPNNELLYKLNVYCENHNITFNQLFIDSPLVAKTVTEGNQTNIYSFIEKEESI